MSQIQTELTQNSENNKRNSQVVKKTKPKNNSDKKKVGVASITNLTKRLAEYLTSSELKNIKDAFRFSDEKHLGQVRRSGEPYISHPIAVAEICADWKLDSQAIMAALLHDVMEDQNIKKEELIERFGAPVATLVDGLSKLDKIEFQSQIDQQAENFRKMLLAMARDIRVILIKLADRLHNMRTLQVMEIKKRKRIAKETMDVYVPIAHRIGLNNIFRELQEISFSFIHPLRFKTISKAVLAARGNRREVVTKILNSVENSFSQAGIEAGVFGREKELFAIYKKMQIKKLSFSQVLDIYGFRVVVENFSNCYFALGILHSVFKPMPGKFKDYIAIPKLNGYQSLHTTVIGPFGTPIEFQIRTKEMNQIAESGVAAHWLYKNREIQLNDLQFQTHAWLKSLLDIQHQTGNSSEFLENVKVDLFPDSVYVFTPESKIIALPLGATALDFAYSIHTDIGDQAISAKINHELSPLKTELRNGDIVSIDVSSDSRPTPSWLNFVRTGKARSAIRNYLKTIDREEAIELGRMLLEQSLAELNLSSKLSPEIAEKLIKESSSQTVSDLFAEIGIGKRLAMLVARRIYGLIVKQTYAKFSMLNKLSNSSIKPVVISGNEPASAVNLSSCCMPIPGDSLIGNLRQDQTLVVHINDCINVKRLNSKDLNRWVPVSWSDNHAKRFDCYIKILIKDEKGALAKLASEITESGSNIIHVEMDEKRSTPLTKIKFMIQVEDRVHLARLMRNIRRMKGVDRIFREKN